MTVLVTGASGFIGNHVVKELLSRGIRVAATSAHKEKAKNYSWFDKVDFFEFDLKGYHPSTNLYQLFGNPDAVIHLAWEGLPNYNEDFHVLENLPRHFLFLENLVANGLRNLTVAGTCLEYGMLEGCQEEDAEVDPTVPYAIAKNELRKSLQQLQDQYPLNLKWARLYFMYGPGQNPRSLFSLIEQALKEQKESLNMSGGLQVRDYLPVEKVAAYIVSAALQTTITGIINICSGKPVVLRDLVQQYIDSKGGNLKINYGFYPYNSYEPMEFWGANNRLKQIIKND